MKLVFLGLILLSGLLCLSCAKKISHPVPSPAPWVHLYSINGTHEILEMHKGQNLVIIFWTTKCRYSVSKLKHLNTLASKSSTTQYLAVCLDEHYNRQKVENLTSKTPYLRHYFSGNGNHDPAWVALRGLAVPAVIYFDEYLNIKKVE